MAARTILHCDLDAFYASAEQLDDPSLRGRPVLVGGESRRGVVAAASYEARKFGVRSAMPMVEARSRCPQAVVLPPRFHRYAELSAAFFAILERYSPLVEGLSLDEAFVDVTGVERLFGDGPAIAARIRREVRAEIGLAVSVGIADCKLVAKIATDLGKPDGVMLVPPGTSRAFLAPLPVSRLWGVGPRAEAELARLAITTIGDVARVGVGPIARRLGDEAGRHLVAMACAEDFRPVDPDRSPVSFGHEDTFEHDIRVRADLATHLLDQADRVAARLRAAQRRARTITLKIKYADHSRISRRRTVTHATCDGQVIAAIARELLVEVPDIEVRGVRLTGVSASGLAAHEESGVPQQLGLLGVPDAAADRRGEALGAAMDKIHARFGEGLVRRAVHVGEEQAGGEARGLNPLRGAGAKERAPRTTGSAAPAGGGTSRPGSDT